MQIISYLANPVVFFSLLVFLFVAYLFALRSFLRQNKKWDKEKDTLNKRNKDRIAELEAAVAGTTERQKEQEKEFQKRVILLETQLKEKEQLKASVARLEAQLKMKEEVLKKEVTSRDEFNKKIKTLQDEVTKLNKELSLKNQMYEGLKGQYDELEKSFEKTSVTPPKETLPNKVPEQPQVQPEIKKPTAEPESQAGAEPL